MVFAAYAALLALPPRQVRRLPLPAWAVGAILLLSAQIHSEDIVPSVMGESRSWLPVWFVPVALAVIVAGSIVMVTTAVMLAQRWQVPGEIVGTVILASITSLPNLYAAVRLALLGDGATVVSEAFNSNTLNLVVGLGLPAVVLGTAVPAPAVEGALVWLGGLSLAAIVVATLKQGLTRLGGVGIIATYAAFLAVVLRTAVT